MCLVVFAWRVHPEYRLVLAANRDEYHARPSRDAHWWPDRKHILAGRDLQAGGTWLAVSRSGRFATVTNYRELQRPARRMRSRGELVSDFVDGTGSPGEFASAIDGQAYAGFSLLIADNDQLVYSSNRGESPVVLQPGVYGLSNATLDTPWPKLVRSRDRLRELIDDDSVNEASLLRLLADRQPAPVERIDHTELPFQLAQAVSAPFIQTPEYGTRCSTSLLWSSAGNVDFCEQNFDSHGKATGTVRHRFNVSTDQKPLAASS
ncbi:MAG: NRDE family protein [Woeseiaceae bacterium]